MSGWPTKENMISFDDVLRYAMIRFIRNRTRCAVQYAGLSNRINITDKMICAGGINAGSCKGDGGGPLTCFKWHPTKRPDEVYLCGIVSFGVGCKSGVPGIYTDVSKYYEWIQEHISAAEQILWGKKFGNSCAAVQVLIIRISRCTAKKVCRNCLEWTIPSPSISSGYGQGTLLWSKCDSSLAPPHGCSLFQEIQALNCPGSNGRALPLKLQR